METDLTVDIKFTTERVITIILMWNNVRNLSVVAELQVIKARLRALKSATDFRLQINHLKCYTAS